MGIVALAMYLRFVHAISDQQLNWLLGELFGLAISEGALQRLPLRNREYWRRLECAVGLVMPLAPTHRDGQRLRKRCGKHRLHLFTFLNHLELPAYHNESERELRSTATYRKLTGGCRFTWGADLFAGVRFVIGAAACCSVGSYQAVKQTLYG